MEHRPKPIWANILTRTKKNEGNIMREINVITTSFSCTIYTKRWSHPFVPITWDLMTASLPL